MYLPIGLAGQFLSHTIDSSLIESRRLGLDLIEIRKSQKFTDKEYIKLVLLNE